MIRKGRILFVNGYWTTLDVKITGKSRTGSSVPLKPYWGQGPSLDRFEKEAERFFNISEEAGTHLYLDGSTGFGGDESGSERSERGARDANWYEWGKSQIKKQYDKYNDGSEETSPLRNAKYDNELRKSFYDHLTEGMDISIHSFYFITHSEGSAYGAGLARMLIGKGWKVHTIVHLSADEGDEFSTPAGPITYQLGYTGRLFDDWVTGNHRILGNSAKWGSVYISDYNAWDEFRAVHGSTRGYSVFAHLWDLKTVFLQQVLDSDGRIHWRQAPGSTPNGTRFAQVDGFVVEGNGRTNRSRWNAIGDFLR